MNRVARAPLALGWILIVMLLGGCYHHSPGTPVEVGQDADLVVHNDSINGLHVYVDGYEIGTVPSLGSAGFRVVTGVHDLSVRERRFYTRHDLGSCAFTLYAVVEVTYRD